MQVVITAVGPDNRGLADPIIHHITGLGANIAEIQMYDHDELSLFAMLLRIDLPAEQWPALRPQVGEIGRLKGLSVRVWSPEERKERPRLAICTTYRPEPALALLRAIRDGRIRAEAAVMLGNRPNCRSLAEQFDVDWHLVGDDAGAADDERCRAVRRVRNRLPDPGPLHAHPAGGQLLEIRRRADHQSAPRPAPQLPRYPALSRGVRQPNVDLWGDVPLHRAGARRGQPDHLSVDVHRSATA